MIPYGRQDITQEDIDAVVDVLKADFITQGPKVTDFEDELKKYTGAQYATAVNSATSALHIACLALGVSNGDIVWTSPITFVASSNCALYCGATVDFVDIDEQTNNMSVRALERKLRQAKADGKLPKVVIPVHLSGLSCDMEAIKRLSDLYGFKIIEDASHAIGGRYRDCIIGNCDYSDITVFSFHPVKIITTAEGGAALTNQKELAGKMELFRSHGVTRDEGLMTEVSHGPWYYQQIALGFNYRITDLQSALGVSQIKRLDQYIKRRNRLAERYNQLLSNLPIELPLIPEDGTSAFHLYIIKLRDSERHETVFEDLRKEGIGVNLHYIPVHLQPYYQNLGFKPGDFPNAEKYYAKAISIPLYAKMTEDEQDTVISAIKKIIL